MLRRAIENDFLDLIAFRSEACGCTRTVAAKWIKDIIGLENILILEKNDKNGKPYCEAAISTIPIRTGYHHGIWLSGMATRKEMRGQGIMKKLLGGCLRAFTEGGCDFVVATPETPQMEQWLAKQDFQKAFSLRTVTREIKSNLLAQADFDVMTVQRLSEARLDYQPNCVILPEECMERIIAHLYSNGMTMVSNSRGYGLFYQKENTLNFIEMQADSARAAEILLQAAREKTGAETATIQLTENQTLFQGEGKRNDYGMVYFLKQPFPVDDIYFQLLL